MTCANCEQPIKYVHNVLVHAHTESPFCGSSHMKAKRKS